MPPRQSQAKKRSRSTINIQRLSEEHLLDKKLLKPKDEIAFRPAVFAILLGILAVGVVAGYTVFSKPSKNIEEKAPIIIVPKEETREPAAAHSPITPQVEEVGEKKRLEILDTPTGFLNVRSGPGTNFAKITQVNPGENYELISTDETKAWYQIKLAQGQTGWVSRQYVKPLTP